MPAPKGIKKHGGRAKGTPNKVTADVRVAAPRFGIAALEHLAHLSTHAESEAAQVAACKEILDRAYGKSAQAVELANKGGDRLVVEIVKKTY